MRIGIRAKKWTIVVKKYKECGRYTTPACVGCNATLSVNEDTNSATCPNGCGHFNIEWEDV